MGLHLLVVEGNTRAEREVYRSAYGQSSSESYARTLRELAPDAAIDTCFPADPDADLPAGAALESYDGIFVTGSALNVYDGGPEITRQIELARAIFRARTPFFGSCWGLQVASAAAGGVVARNPRGREIGIARNIWLTGEGRAHPMLAGRPGAYDALCSHIDAVVTPPPGARVLAANAMSDVQAAEIEWEGGRFWGVQYHPEYAFAEVAAIIHRRAGSLAREGLVASEEEARTAAAELTRLDGEEAGELAWKLGVGEEALTTDRRRLELRNFIESWARPTQAARGRS